MNEGLLNQLIEPLVERIKSLEFRLAKAEEQVRDLLADKLARENHEAEQSEYT
jgi:hypothetical protein